jgi:hypothetical protein
MGSDDSRRRLNRKTTIETLEERRVMSADPLGGLLGGSLAQDEQAADLSGVPVLELHQPAGFAEQSPDFWLDTTYGSFEEQLDQIEQTLASAHGVTGLTQVRQDYGFLGTGQTVAVIDSGIAWDHYALGGGFGADYRVVGGWDFTEENDADPYDDGPSGSHGTHVAGIVGGNPGDSSADTGVAPGVDLVGLRVFNDAGAGYFSWVENALEWVHQNRNSFENPITVVNLSLGTNWNADSVPSWAMLEDEFAQLEADGIFIAVSAGNGFATYNTPGLSYPAASSHVVPVMSVDDSGLLSYYSQRSDRSIAAPGRFIRSTVPDYAGNHNGATDDWASFSGTSMASPYVAGASVLVREAMEFVGYSNITQQTIYDHMIATADRFFDAATNAYYNRLNLANAIDALMPDDDFGSSMVDAYDMGTLGGGAGGLAAATSSMEMAGLIGKLDDADYFTFTAAASGTVNLTVTGTHGLVPHVTLVGAEATLQDGTWSFDVVAGGIYTMSVQTGAEKVIGYYEATAEFKSSATLVKARFTESGVNYSLDSDGWLSIDGVQSWANTQDFALGADGTLYLLGTDGCLCRQLADQSWQVVSNDATKFAVTESGVVYSLSSDNWASVNGRKVYWLGTNGRLQRQLQNRTWQDIDFHVAKFDVSDDGIAFSLNDQGWLSVNGRKTWSNTQDFSLAGNGALTYLQEVERTVVKIAVNGAGVVYSLDSEGWLSVNGRRIWSSTNDFSLAKDGTLHWLGTSGRLQQRLSNGAWKDIGRDVVKFNVSDNGPVYSLDTGGWLSVNGERVRSSTNDFSLASDGELCWLGTTGQLQKRLTNGSWQDIDQNSTQFALRDDGVVYSLESDGNVKVGSDTKWSNIQSMQLTDTGYLELKCADGGTYWCAGRFAISRAVGAATNTFAAHFVSAGVNQASGRLNSFNMGKDSGSAGSHGSADLQFVLEIVRTSGSANRFQTVGGHVTQEQQEPEELNSREVTIAGDNAAWQSVRESNALYDWKDFEVGEHGTLGDDLEMVASQKVGADNPSVGAKTTDQLFERFGARE